MNLDEYNELNWCKLSELEKKEYITLYFQIYTSQNTLRLSKEKLKEIKLNSIQGNTSNYKAETINHNYIHNICYVCNKNFELTHSQVMSLKKDINKIIFCSKECASKYTAIKWHNEKSVEEKAKINNKISNTMIMKEQTYTDEQIKTRADKLNAYWKDMSAEERSLKNKKAAIKTKAVKLVKYGDENYNNRQKSEQTNLEKYGVKNTYKMDKAIENAKSIMKEKYGVENFFENRELFEQISLERYGTKHPMQNETIQSKLADTKLERYGDKNYNNIEKRRKTCIERYGRISTYDLQKSRYTKLNRYGDENYNNKEKALKTIYERYGKDYYDKQLSTLGNRISKINREFAKYINTNQFEYPIGKYSFDLKMGDILIEIDPIFTHNSYEHKLFGRFGGLDKNYHMNKSKLANSAGYFCIHIFDWDNWEKIKYLLQDKETLYARNLELREVSTDDTDDFLNKYHLQDTCRGQTIRLGLYKGDILIELMTFGKPRYNKNYEWELLRLCTHKDYKVVGGAEKLFKHFLKKYNPDSVISYCDFSKFNGNVYERLGFVQKGKITPSKHWVKNNEHITDNLLRQRGYDQLFKTNYGKGTSNEELMLQNGWLPIYDCGQLTFIWINENM